MKLTTLNIRKLHGCYNYSIAFNSDVTFIYGANGCGKTTILNITEAIITGHLFKLFTYTFDEIELKYAAAAASQENVISIRNIKEDQSLVVSFLNQQHTLRKLSFETRRMNHKEVSVYFEQYPFLRDISKTFNYVYLPLNRTSIVRDWRERDVVQIRRDHVVLDDAMIVNEQTIDIAIHQIERLVSDRYAIINAQLARISDTFRNNVLKSALVTHPVVTFEELLKNGLFNTDLINHLTETKTKYIKVLTDLDLITEEDAVEHGAFFDSLIEAFKKIKNLKETDALAFFVKLTEIERIDKMIAMAEELERKKAEIKKPISVFLSTMNSFIYNEEDRKEIKIDATGRIYFTTKYNSKHISIHHLSSGEKQLLMFFANLIFSVKSNSPGIFVVDEPELSLHLSWQQVFVDKALEINKNLQLIFATHAPEIIGHRRSKMFRLVKEYTE